MLPKINDTARNMRKLLIATFLLAGLSRAGAVEITNRSTGTSVTIKPGSDGSYSFSLAEGSYTLKLDAEEMKQFQGRGTFRFADIRGLRIVGREITIRSKTEQVPFTVDKAGGPLKYKFSYIRGDAP